MTRIEEAGRSKRTEKKLTIPEDTLAGWRAFCEQVRNTTFAVRRAYAAGRPMQAGTLLQQIHDAAESIAREMEQPGAERPKTLSLPSNVLPDNPVPPERLSTPTSRAYADAIERAYALALAVDRERGCGDSGPAGALEAFVDAAMRDAYGPMAE